MSIFPGKEKIRELFVFEPERLVTREHPEGIDGFRCRERVKPQDPDKRQGKAYGFLQKGAYHLRAAPEPSFSISTMGVPRPMEGSVVLDDALLIGKSAIYGPSILSGQAILEDSVLKKGSIEGTTHFIGATVALLDDGNPSIARGTFDLTGLPGVLRSANDVFVSSDEQVALALTRGEREAYLCVTAQKRFGCLANKLLVALRNCESGIFASSDTFPYETPQDIAMRRIRSLSDSGFRAKLERAILDFSGDRELMLRTSAVRSIFFPDLAFIVLDAASVRWVVVLDLSKKTILPLPDWCRKLGWASPSERAEEFLKTVHSTAAWLVDNNFCDSWRIELLYRTRLEFRSIEEIEKLVRPEFVFDLPKAIFKIGQEEFQDLEEYDLDIGPQTRRDALFRAPDNTVGNIVTIGDKEAAPERRETKGDAEEPGGRLDGPERERTEPVLPEIRTENSSEAAFLAPETPASGSDGENASKSSRQAGMKLFEPRYPEDPEDPYPMDRLTPDLWSKAKIFPTSVRPLPSAVIEEIDAEIKAADRNRTPVAEFLYNYPWLMKTEEKNDLSALRAELDRTHYGMEDLKIKIMEYAAARILGRKRGGGGRRSKALCLVGPPGTGKSTIARSIAIGTARRLIRIQMGGQTDSDMLIGFARSYRAAEPGEIVRSLIRCGSSNPVMLLDEVDKAKLDTRDRNIGGVLNALLDPSQNMVFKDNFLPLPIDLSDILFVLTANSVSNLPEWLMDRIEVMETWGYSLGEKERTCSDFIVPRVRSACGLTEEELSLSGPVLRELLSRCSPEAGLRQAERTLENLARRRSLEVLEHGEPLLGPVPSIENCFAALGLSPDKKRPEKPAIGLASCLSRTAMGGDVVSVEAKFRLGQGKILLSGTGIDERSREKARESAAAALEFVRGLECCFDFDWFGHDLLLHVYGKERSKGVELEGLAAAAAILSAASGIPVRHDAAAAGELSPFGTVVYAGGTKDRLAAAVRDGIETVVLPEANRPDVDKSSPDILSALDIRFVSDARDAMPLLLVGIELSSPFERAPMGFA